MAKVELTSIISAALSRCDCKILRLNPIVKDSVELEHSPCGTIVIEKCLQIQNNLVVLAISQSGETADYTSCF